MNFWLLSVGGLVFGFYSGFAQLYRFAAADGISERYRSVAISLVLAGGVFSGFAGAGLAIWGENMVPDSWYSGDVPRQFGGTFMFLTGTAVSPQWHSFSFESRTFLNPSLRANSGQCRRS